MQSIKGGIPVGGNLGAGALAGGLSFPIGPQKSDPDEEAQFKEMFKAPGSWRQQIKDYQRQNPLQRQMPSAGIGNVGGLLLAQNAPFYGDTIDMGPAPGTYSNMPVIPDEAEEQFQREMLLEQFRNRAFPPVQTPVGFGGTYVS